MQQHLYTRGRRGEMLSFSIQEKSGIFGCHGRLASINAQGRVGIAKIYNIPTYYTPHPGGTTSNKFVGWVKNEIAILRAIREVDVTYKIFLGEIIFSKHDQTRFILAMPQYSETIQTLIDNRYFAGEGRLWELRRMFLEALLGLDALHKLRIIHGDIKPDNIMVDTRYRHVRIIDYSCSTLSQAPASHTYIRASGAYPFRPPEAANGTPINGLAYDIFMLGVTMWLAIVSRHWSVSAVTQQMGLGGYRYDLTNSTVRGYISSSPEYAALETMKVLQIMLNQFPSYRRTARDIVQTKFFNTLYKVPGDEFYPLREYCIRKALTHTYQHRTQRANMNTMFTPESMPDWVDLLYDSRMIYGL